MVTVARPNKDAMVRALDIYRDAMRPFIVINLGPSAAAPCRTISATG